MNNDIEKVLFSQEQLNSRMDEMAARLNEKYAGEEPIVIPVLNGAMIFASDMIKRLTFKLTIDPIKASSYAGTSSTGNVKIMQDIKSDVQGRPVIFMEDIIDTGRTLQALTKVMAGRSAKSVEVIAMLDKPETRVVDFHADDYGFKAPNEFLVGYGLDYNGLYRNLPFVGVLKQRVYA
ncbi:hypoxanthine phosphoribosyltransferase [Lactobacillus kefiranofaciens subsp. kefirgranum]|uniref:hypoxanthine phosphoribosyltransferase n=1 Tax=Lactobacillus kefiranofaciens TaxID=267818 RepID=UPI00202F44A8|nr:hypoxanthine phosphoribosyltransferase [Lactobacillus kefiranofaciens]URW72369.1 hypoxanthine phosphoribosyltransferase [Lactobacillus kefiranofaciens subsp. kefirgranum]URW74306.1 hypoxanthine phosphoribosyltransferase [Lactobacillus kefiranofaciens subsp. kefirgranum]